MNDLDLKRRLRSARWPSPSPELRARIEATAVRPRESAWSDRMWYSRTWRLGMAAAGIALIALDYWAAPGTTSPTASTNRAGVEPQTIEDLVRSAGLPDDMAASIARRSLIAPRASTIDRASLLLGDNR